MGWGNNNVIINNNFNNRYGYNNINNIQGGNRTNVGNGNRNGNSWQHNPSHRGAVPYSNRGTAQNSEGVRGIPRRTQRFDNRGGQARNRRSGPRREQSGTAGIALATRAGTGGRRSARQPGPRWVIAASAPITAGKAG